MPARLRNLQDHPRLRGEYEVTAKYPVTDVGSPPLARGIHNFCHHRNGHCGITPACAGNTQPACYLSHHRWDHPRLRGEYALRQAVVCLVEGSPPLARGIPALLLPADPCRRITPACAGNTLIQINHKMGIDKSPPLARGILRKSCDGDFQCRITPACAGNTSG